MAEEYTCIECESLYDDSDGDVEERMCYKCVDKIYTEDSKRQSKERVKSVMSKIDELINMLTVKGSEVVS